MDGRSRAEIWSLSPKRILLSITLQFSISDTSAFLNSPLLSFCRFVSVCHHMVPSLSVRGMESIHPSTHLSLHSSLPLFLLPFLCYPPTSNKQTLYAKLPTECRLQSCRSCIFSLCYSLCLPRYRCKLSREYMNDI